MKFYAEDRLEKVNPLNNTAKLKDPLDEELSKELGEFGLCPDYDPPGRKNAKDNTIVSTSGAALLNDVVQINIISLLMMRK